MSSQAQIISIVSWWQSAWNLILRTSQAVPHQSWAFWVHLQNIFLHSSSLMFVHHETCSTKHNDTSGKEVQSCPWKHLQATTSIPKYPPTSRSLVLIFCQLQLHLHMGLTVLLSLDLHVYFFAQNWPRYWKIKMRRLLEIPAGHQMNCSSWYKPASWEPTEKRAAWLFHSSCTLGHCYCLWVFLHIQPWSLMDFFKNCQ